MSNKIRYNIKNVHYAKITKDDDGTVTYGTPVAIPGAVNLSLDQEGEVSKFYADGIVYYQGVSNNGYSGDLEIALIPDSFRTDILNETLDAKKVMIEKADGKVNEFALMFEFDGDEKAIRHVLYDCVATRPSIEGATSEDTIEPQTETISLSAVPLTNGCVKAKTGAETDQAAYDGWYSAVYVKTDL